MLRKLHGTATATVIKGTPERKPIKLYFALLNKGWIRREVAAHELPTMKKTPGVELYWEEPSKTWGHPIYSNRNAICQRFLKSDCDFLMMQDDDVIPQGHNPAELVYANKDIIGCPAKVRSAAGTLDWVAYVWHEEAGGYTTVDMAYAPSEAELLSVDIVGTGLILIRRNVVEELDKLYKGVGMFTVENNEDGVCEWGTDFAFCKRARKAGFEVYTTPWRICEHIKEAGLLDIAGYDDCDNLEAGNFPYKIPWGTWAIQQRDWRFIRDVMDEYSVKKVVEFGSGLSSLLMSERAEVWTFETDPEWAKGIEEKRLPTSTLLVLPWDGMGDPDTSQTEHPDMVFIDGPKARMNGGPGRSKSYETAVALKPRIIVTHDSGRTEEVALSARFLRGAYDLVKKNGNHQTRCELWRLREE